MTANKDVRQVGAEEFVRLWLDAYKRGIGLMGLVKEQNWQYTQTSAKASGLRRAKVKLPTMKSPTQKNNYLTVDSKALNKMITDELGEEALDWRNR